MNKKALLIIAAVLLLLAGAWYYTSAKKSGIGSGTETTSGTKSLKDLLSSGVAQKCTFSTTNESGVSEGTSYVSGGKVRGDFTTTVSGKTTKSHMISDGKSSYIWNDEDKTGFKMTIDETTQADVTKDSDTPTSIKTEGDLDQKADYKCSKWIVDGSYFTPPSNISFTDFSQMLNPSAAPSQGTGSSTSSQCSYCASLSGDDKTQCLTALKCN